MNNVGHWAEESMNRTSFATDPMMYQQEDLRGDDGEEIRFSMLLQYR